MTRSVLIALMAAPLFAQPDLKYVLDRVEEHYNRTKTLKLSFTETYTAGGRSRKMEAGELFLRKPGRMRWEYREPLGKLFISDGKNLYLYTPHGMRAEKMRLRETDDLRAPLAFLLGKLDFDRDFQNFRVKHVGSDFEITADPKSERLPYKHVEFTVGPEFQIRRLNVHGHDTSVLAFTFANETVNPQLADSVFRFKLPAGATLVDTAEARQSNGAAEDKR